MKILAIVQARMGSTRLPGKVMLKLGGQSVLQQVVERLRKSRLLDDVVVATTTSAEDDVIVGDCNRLGVSSYRGSESDVLDRYYHAVVGRDASSIVRITADCPLIDSVLVDQTIRTFLDSNADYANNVSPRTYPRGLDVEVMKVSALDRAWHEARKSYEREHVTPYLYEHPELFRLAALTGEVDYSCYRWTLDTPEDFVLLTRLCARLENRADFSWQDAVAIMQQDPSLAELNADIVQKSLHTL